MGQLMKLENTRVLVTGGSAGLGAAVAKKFVAEGAHVAINYASSKDQAEKTRSDILASYPSAEVVILQGDVSRSGTCESLVKETVAQLGGIDCIISNAGWTKASSWEDLDALTEEEWDYIYAMNVKSHLFLFKAAKPYFLTNEAGGNMVITTSVAGVLPRGSALAYSVSKHAAIALAKGLALHQGPKCRINTVAPGLIETEWAVKQFGRDTIEQMRRRGPLGKVRSFSKYPSDGTDHGSLPPSRTVQRHS